MAGTSFTGWHAHVYFDADSRAAAESLCARVRDRFGVEMGRIHERPVGPHPRGSCQLSVPPGLFGEVIPWLAANRGGLTVFAHGESGDPLADHTDHVLWLGPSEPINLSIFDKA